MMACVQTPLSTTIVAGLRRRRTLIAEGIRIRERKAMVHDRESECVYEEQIVGKERSEGNAVRGKTQRDETKQVRRKGDDDDKVEIRKHGQRDL
jgi:IS30 family transposase